MSHCDEFLESGNCVTYCNHSLKQSSFLDHMFVSDSVRRDIVCAELYDTGLNLSDHIPIIFQFRWSLSHRTNPPTISKKVKQYSWRWDKSDLDYYYQCTYNNLNALNVPNGCGCSVKFSCSSHMDIINIYYENIVAALHDAARTSINVCHATL